VKIPHDRVTVNRIDSESRAACPKRFVSWMFREKASAANTVFFECPVFLSDVDVNTGHFDFWSF